MHTTRMTLACALVTLAMPVLPNGAQSLPDAIGKLQSTQATVRMQGFDDIFRLANTGFPPSASLRPGAAHVATYARAHVEVVPALIALLERENTLLRQGEGRELGEAYAVDYYGNLIGTVAALRDRRAVKALMGAIETGGMATQGLAALGEDAFPAVVQAARSRNHMTQIAALSALAEMLAADRTPTGASVPSGPQASATARLKDRSRAEARSVFLAALKDKNVSMRMMGLRGIVYFDDAQARAAVQNLADRDEHTTLSNGRVVYPVRELAQAALKKQESLKQPQH